MVSKSTCPACKGNRYVKVKDSAGHDVNKKCPGLWWPRFQGNGPAIAGTSRCLAKRAAFGRPARMFAGGSLSYSDVR